MDLTEKSIYERGMLILQKREQERELAQEIKQREELSSLQDYPLISDKSREIIGDRDPSAFLEYMTDWQNEKNRKIEANRSQVLFKSATPEPRPPPPGYQDPLTAWEAQVNHYYELRSQQPPPHPHTPEINKNSRKMFQIHSGTVEERLLKHHKEQLVRRKEAVEHFMNKKPSFKPNTNPYEKPRPQNVTDHLYRRGVSLTQRKKEAAETVYKKHCPFKPQINPNSQELAEAWRSKDHTKPEPVQVSAPVKYLNKEDFQNFLNRNYNMPLKKSKSPEPQVESKKTPQKRTIDKDRLYRLANCKLQVKAQKQFVHKELKELQELENCTFKPRILKRSKTPPPTCERFSTKNLSYNKSPKKDHRETATYTDKANQTYALKGTFLTDKSVFSLLEELEKRVFSVI